MGTPFLEWLGQARPKSHVTTGRNSRPALGDAGFRQRIHGAALMLVSVVGLATGLLVTGLGYATVVAGGIGAYGFHLWRR